jgi:hypothetical protein
MKSPGPNTIKGIILAHMSRSVWVSSDELFNQLEHAGYSIFSIASMRVTMRRFLLGGMIMGRKVTDEGYPYYQYRLPDDLKLEPYRPKLQVTIDNVLREIRL